MTDKNYPRFIKNSPHGIDKYEGKSADKVAEALKYHIENHNESERHPKIIGLDGEWGSGKSNIIRILKELLGNDYYLFEYDAWGHQEDLQRRSFLETLTKELIIGDPPLLLGEISNNIGGVISKISWEEKLKYLLAKKFETEKTSYPKIGIGIIISFFTAVLTPIFVYIAHTLKLNQKDGWGFTLLSIIISFLPVITTLLLWCWYIYKDPKKYKNIHYLLAVFQDKVKEETEFKTISENEPSVSEFKEWMIDLSTTIGENKKNLIIVFDNMDRLPSKKVKELWSSIHTFFAEDQYENIWVIIPFDRIHLANAWEIENTTSLKLTNHFIEKTFPVVYRVAPPILTDWKKVFKEFFEDAFSTEEDKNRQIIQRIWGILMIEFTPRSIITFINELVSMKMIWQDKIPLIPMAVFALLKDEIKKNTIDNILSGEYLKKIDSLVKNDEDFQIYITALTYGIELNIAKQIPLIQYLKETLRGDKKRDINKHSEHSHFIELFDEVIKDIDIATIDDAIISMSSFNSDTIDITHEWDQLIKMHLQTNTDKLEFKETHKALLQNASKKNKELFLNKLLEDYRNCSEFKGDQYFTTMENIGQFITDKKINIILSEFIIEKNVIPEVFIEYSNKAKTDYKKCKLTCDNNDLNDHIINLFPSELPNLNFIEYLIDNENYSFDLLNDRIEKAIANNEITPTNFQALIKTQKAISKSKPLSKLMTQGQIRSILNAITDKTSDEYYDLVSMSLANKTIDTPYVEGLDENVAEVIEYYKDYGQLLIISVEWKSVLLRKSLKIITERDFGDSIMNIEDILPKFNQIIDAIDINESDFLSRLNHWEKDASNILSLDNIEAMIPNFNFYDYTIYTKNELTNFINDLALEKIKTITTDVLYQQRDTPTYYWTNCISSLIRGNVLNSLSDNITDLCKRILEDISTGIQVIPTPDSILGVIINNADKDKLQSTIKSICDDFCNRKKDMTPKLFKYFASNFDFINKMTSREDDITRNILTVVIGDLSCLAHILENREGYIQKINSAGNDAEELKNIVKGFLQSDYSNDLKSFADSIGIEDKDEKTE